MPFFQVQIPELHYCVVEIAANNESDAIKRAIEGDGQEIAIEYSHTIDDDDLFKIVQGP